MGLIEMDLESQREETEWEVGQCEGTRFMSSGTNTELFNAVNSKNVSRATGFLSSLTNPSDVSKALLGQNSWGDTPLHCAARKGVSDLVELFISRMSNPEEKRALVRIKNRQGDTALHLAARNNHSEVVDMLINADAKLGSIPNEFLEYPLYVAAHKGFRNITEKLVAFPASGPCRKTALHAAVSQNHEEVVELLLEKRPELCREKDESGSTSLLYAAASGNSKILQALLDIDVSCIELSDNNGLSALHVAAARGHTNVLNILAQPMHNCGDFIDNTGQTFLHVAIANKRVKVVIYVVESRFIQEEILNQPDDEGNTPLHLAVMQSEKNIVRFLLADNRVVLDNVNRNGQTPLDIAYSMLMDSPTNVQIYQIKNDFTSRGFKYSAQRLDLVCANLDIKTIEEENKKVYRSVENNLSVISSLIATVTFAAGFALPGGYKNDAGAEQGTATLTKAVAFKVFLVSNTFAMMTSIVVIWLLLYTAASYQYFQRDYINASMILLSSSIVGMVVAFPAGVYAVVSADSQWLAVLICIMAAFVLLTMMIIRYSRLFFYEVNVIRDRIRIKSRKILQYFTRKFKKGW